MSAQALLNDLNRAGATVEIRGDKLHIAAPRGTVTPALRQALTTHKPELLAVMMRT